ncbi:DUF1360 domain-containing protein [Streptomyces sp. NPDC015414]|uniref:DUF1360 domain-containing protein n=1 Tax=Streptomyces sp. NPDC015414 TaxID=3364957 RepID=UPI003700647D
MARGTQGTRGGAPGRGGPAPGRGAHREAPCRRTTHGTTTRATCPSRGYAALASVLAAGVGTYAVAARRRGVTPPGELPPRDVALPGTATYTVSRLLTRERITSFLRAPFTRGADEGEAGEVLNDDSRGTGTRRAVGDLPRCPCRASARWRGLRYPPAPRPRGRPGRAAGGPARWRRSTGRGTRGRGPGGRSRAEPAAQPAAGPPPIRKEPA